jgi:predicted amidohydrolase YtcJ
MTREEALKSFTIWAAYGQFEENIKGSLKAGKLADFVVIDRDYMKCPESEIKDINALTTVVGGEVVYQKSP